MNKQCKDLLDKLSFFEYKTFIRNALGLLFFYSNEYLNTHIILSSRRPRTTNNNVHELYNDAVAYAYFENENYKSPYYEFVFYVGLNDYKNKTFRQNSLVETIDSYFLNGKLTDSDLFFLLLVSFDGSDNSLVYKKTDLTLKTYKDINNIYLYSFILGSGLDSDYGVGDWEKLVNVIDNKTSSLSGVPVKILRKFSKDRCNTNYYTPQILKDINQIKYFDLIQTFLYKSFKVRDTDYKSSPLISDRNLFQICRILATQSEFSNEQTVLTFNYDDIVEQTLLNSFGKSSFSSFKDCGNANDSIVIEHVHGMLPYKSVTDKHKNSIVLSHDEYLNNYSSTKSYSYSKLYAQLRKRNLIIGNSVSDYEEQKVFYNHHRMYLNEFSYALMVKNSVDWLNYYTVVSLYKIGIIPIFFDSYEKMCDYLKTIWPPIEND